MWRLTVPVLALYAAANAPFGPNRSTASAAVPHADLESSVPRDKARLLTIPTELRLTFTEAPEMPFTRIRLRAPDSQYVSLGKLNVVDTAKVVVVAPIPTTLAPGTYTVEWEVAGEDGHPVDGTFTFTVAPEAVRAPTGATTDLVRDSRGDTVHHDTTTMPRSADRFDAESWGYVLVRFALYIGLLTALGAIAFRAIVVQLMSRRFGAEGAFLSDAGLRAASLGRAGAWLLLGACVARLVVQSLALNGSDAMLDTSRLGVLIGDTKWGRVWVIQFIAAVVLLYGFVVTGRRDVLPSLTGKKQLMTPRTGLLIAGIAALVLAFTPAFSGHAAASPRLRPIALLFDGLHVIGAGGWLGSLFLVVAAGIPAAMSLGEERRGGAVRDLVNAFSPTALVFASLLATTGVFAAWLHLGSFAALWESRYGNVLLAKLAILSVVALTGAYNWRRVKPTLGTTQGSTRIRRSAVVEVAAAVLVVLVTAVLVATPPPLDGM